MSDGAAVRAGGKMQKVLGAWLLVAALTVFAIAPLTYPGTLQTQSGPLAPIKAEHPTRAPAWVGNATSLQGEGALPYLLLWPIRQLSVDGPVAIRWGYALAILLAAWAMFAWTHRWLGIEGAVLAAAVYTYLPWHLGTVYVRGAYAEAWLWVLWPAILWAVDQVTAREHLSRPALVARGALGLLCLAAAFETHTGLAATSFPFLAGYSAVRLTSQRRPVWSTVAVALAAALAGWLGPAALGRQAVTQDVASELLYPAQLFSAAWGATQSLPLNPLDGSGWMKVLPISYQLGLASVGLSVVAVVLFAGRKPDRSVPDRGTAPTRSRLPGHVFCYWLSAALLAILLTLRPAAFVWQITGFHALLSDPWQFLALAGWPLAFLSGSAIRQGEGLGRLPAWAGLVALVILASYPTLAPHFIPAGAGADRAEPLALFQSADTRSPQIMLLNADVDQPSEADGESRPLSLTLAWQCLEEVEQDYTVFVHILTADDGGAKVAQRDARPCDGDCPTDSWQRGDVIVNQYEFGIPKDAPPPPYRIAVGLYLLETGERASVVGRDETTVYVDVQ